jgi:hypothetical protein
MKRYAWTGWLVAGLLLLQNATVALSAPTVANPLEGQLLQHSSGALYLYHAGVKFTVQVADIGDHLIDAIPTASGVEWQTLFTDATDAPRVTPPVREQPAPPNS